MLRSQQDKIVTGVGGDYFWWRVRKASWGGGLWAEIWVTERNQTWETFLAGERQCKGPWVRYTYRCLCLGEGPAQTTTVPYLARAGSAQPLPQTLHVAPGTHRTCSGEALNLVCRIRKYFSSEPYFNGMVRKRHKGVILSQRERPFTPCRGHSTVSEGICFRVQLLKLQVPTNRLEVFLKYGFWFGRSKVGPEIQQF